MIGSTFIHETDAERLKCLQDDLDDIDQFETVALDVMQALDFEMICGEANLRWNVGKPAVLDAEGGLVVCLVSPAALHHVLNGKHDLTSEQLDDIESLKEFVRRNGPMNIYELSTF